MSNDRNMQWETRHGDPAEYRIGDLVLGDEWEIRKVLGTGSFGRVYGIEKTDYGMTVRSAFKVIRIGADEAETEELLDRGLDSASVGQYYAAKKDDTVREVAVMLGLQIGRAHV